MATFEVKQPAEFRSSMALAHAAAVLQLLFMALADGALAARANPAQWASTELKTKGP